MLMDGDCAIDLKALMDLTTLGSAWRLDNPWTGACL